MEIRVFFSEFFRCGRAVASGVGFGIALLFSGMSPASAQSIVELQQALQNIGCFEGEIDGKKSLKLRTAIRCFQKTRTGWQPTGNLTSAQFDELLRDVAGGIKVERAAPAQVGLSKEELQAIRDASAKFDSEDNIGASRTTTPFETPIYLQRGKQRCFEYAVFHAADKASCRRLAKELLESNGCPTSELAEDELRYRIAMETCFRVRFASAFGKKDMQKIIRKFREEKIRALRVAHYNTDDRRRRFMVDTLPFEIPVSFKKKTIGSGVYQHSNTVTIWTNLDPFSECPTQAFILVEFVGQNPLSRWIDDDYPAQDLVRTISRTVRRDNNVACLGSRDYEIIAHAFNSNDYMATTIVPTHEIRQDEFGAGADFLFNNLVPEIRRYALQRSPS